MDDGVKRLPILLIGEDKVGQVFSIDRARFVEDLLSKRSLDFLPDLRITEAFAGDSVRIYDRGAQRFENPGDRRFATPNATQEAYDSVVRFLSHVTACVFLTSLGFDELGIHLR